MRFHSIETTHKLKAGKRVGRGISAGQGKTAGRGTKGQKARTGANSNIPRTFDGGSTSMIQRLPKLKGFKSRRVKAMTLNVARLIPHFDDKATITFNDLLEKKLVTKNDSKTGVKVVGSSTLMKKSFNFDTTDSKLTVSTQLQNK